MTCRMTHEDKESLVGLAKTMGSGRMPMKLGEMSREAMAERIERQADEIDRLRKICSDRGQAIMDCDVEIDRLEQLCTERYRTIADRELRITLLVDSKKGWTRVAENQRRVIELQNERLARSVRVEDADFDGERGCRFVVGDDHVVAEWRGDGIAADTVFGEEPRLAYGVTTTPNQRCIRMAFEMAHWPILCAMLVGHGDGVMTAPPTLWDDGGDDK